MGINSNKLKQSMLSYKSVKVHGVMCKNLVMITNRIMKIIPSIESAQPRCVTGIRSLCSLNQTVDKAKLLVQFCTESSKLFLAVLGKSIVSRCQMIQISFEQSLCEIQSMVPQDVSTKVSKVLGSLRCTEFSLDFSEEEAGNALLTLIREDKFCGDIDEASEFKVFQLATLKLNISSPLEILIEKRSIKSLIQRVNKLSVAKVNILNNLLYFLRKYGSLLSFAAKQISNTHSQDIPLIKDTPFLKTMNGDNRNKEDQHDEKIQVSENIVEPNTLLLPPETFVCPLSLKIMHDPVTIASGKTYERVSIENWFSQGNHTCPVTKIKLPHLCTTPNTSIKDLILAWCKKQDIVVPPPCEQFEDILNENCHSLDSVPIFSTYSSSIQCEDLVTKEDLMGSPDDRCLDTFNIDLESYGASQRSIFGHNESPECLTIPNLGLARQYLDFLLEFSKYSLDTQNEVLKDFEVLLAENEEACISMLTNGFLDALLEFLMGAHDLNNINIHKLGADIFLLLVTNVRKELPLVPEYAFHLVVSLLNLGIAEEALAIMRILFKHDSSRSQILEAVVPWIIEIFDSHNNRSLTAVIKFLRDLSLQKDTLDRIVSPRLIQKLVPLLCDPILSVDCIGILQNISDFQDGRVWISEADSCLTSIVGLLKNESSDVKELVISLLLSLCWDNSKICELVMEGDTVSSLVTISVNGSKDGKEKARNLLMLLGSIRYSV